MRYPNYRPHIGDVVEWWNEDSRHQGEVTEFKDGNYILTSGIYDGIVVNPYRISKIIKKGKLHLALGEEF